MLYYTIRYDLRLYNYYYVLIYDIQHKLLVCLSSYLKNSLLYLAYTSLIEKYSINTCLHDFCSHKVAMCCLINITRIVINSHINVVVVLRLPSNHCDCAPACNIRRSVYIVQLIDWLILFLSITRYMLWKKVLNTMFMIIKMVKV